MFPESVDEEVAACGELLPKRPKVGAPSGLGDDIERGRLKGSAHAHGLRLGICEDAVSCGTPSDEPGDLG